MADPKIAGVGAFGDLGTHSLDVLMWLLGPVESTTAEVRVITGRYGDCDETGTAMLKMKDGVVATLVAGWVDVANPLTLQIAGTEGHAVIVADQLYFESKRVPGSKLAQAVTGLPPGPKPPLMQWVDAVGGQKDQPLVTPAGGGRPRCRHGSRLRVRPNRPMGDGRGIAQGPLTAFAGRV